MDSSGRPRGEGESARKAQKGNFAKVECVAYKLDEVANWKDWAAMAGVRVKGLRAPAASQDKLTDVYTLVAGV